MAEKQEAFDRELQETRRAWDKEKIDRARTVQEDNEAYGKVQQREQQEANYILTQKRELDNDAYEHQKKHREAELTDYTKGQHKSWDEREKLIADQEKAYNEAKQKVEEAPKQLEAALKKAREEGKGVAFSQAKIKGDLIAKDIEGEKRVFDLKIKSLEDSNKEQAGRVDSLTKLLATTLAQAQNLAVKSIEGASNASTYVAVKEIALEQAKNMPKNKG
jgi:membrane protein involved in colicin uptake